MSTLHKKFPKERYPNVKYIQESLKDKTDSADTTESVNTPKVRLWFYENKEDNEFVITDGNVLLFKGVLLNGELSCTIFMWKLRSDNCIYGVGLAEMLEGNQTMLDRIFKYVNQPSSTRYRWCWILRWKGECRRERYDA